MMILIHCSSSGRVFVRSYMYMYVYVYVSVSAYGDLRRDGNVLLPAPRKIRGGSAEDPRKTPAEDMSRGAHGKENHQFSLCFPDEGWKYCFSCIAEDPRKICGRPPRKT